MILDEFQLERYFAKYEFTAPYLLCSSDCESLAVKDLLALEPGAEDQLHDLWLGYTESLGHPELRAMIADLYEQVAPDDVLVHAGAEEAIFNFMNVVLRPGDHIVVHTPCYQSLGEVARSIGAEVTGWEGDPSQGWALELDNLKPLLTPRTKVVVVNFPHNPTGFMPEPAFMHALNDLAEQHGFIVFSDEVYRGLEQDLADRLPAMADVNPRSISLGVMSKTYGLAGLRIGWIATRDPKLYAAMAGFKDYTTICNSAPSEFLATLALRHANVIVDRNKQIIHQNLALLDDFFARHATGFDWHRPKGGPIAFPGWKGDSVDALCANLVDQAGVLLLPGTLYGEGYNAFRIGFGRKNLPEALAKFEAYLAGK